MTSKAQRDTNLDEIESEHIYSEPIYATPTKKKHNRRDSIQVNQVNQATIERRKKQKAEYVNVTIQSGSHDSFVG